MAPGALRPVCGPSVRDARPPRAREPARDAGSGRRCTRWCGPVSGRRVRGPRLRSRCSGRGHRGPGDCSGAVRVGGEPRRYAQNADAAPCPGAVDNSASPVHRASLGRLRETTAPAWKTWWAPHHCAGPTPGNRVSGADPLRDPRPTGHGRSRPPRVWDRGPTPHPPGDGASAPRNDSSCRDGCRPGASAWAPPPRRPGRYRRSRRPCARRWRPTGSTAA